VQIWASSTLYLWSYDTFFKGTLKPHQHSFTILLNVVLGMWGRLFLRDDILRFLLIAPLTCTMCWRDRPVRFLPDLPLFKLALVPWWRYLRAFLIIVFCRWIPIWKLSLELPNGFCSTVCASENSYHVCTLLWGKLLTNHHAIIGTNIVHSQHQQCWTLL
jgi:hypothetical protein